MIIYSPQHNVIQKLFVSGDWETDLTVHIMSSRGLVRTSRTDDAQNLILYLDSCFESGEIIVLEDTDINETLEDWGEEAI